MKFADKDSDRRKGDETQHEMRKQVLKVRNWVHDEGTNQDLASVSQRRWNTGRDIPATDLYAKSTEIFASQVAHLNDNSVDTLGLSWYPFSHLSYRNRDFI